MVVDAAVDVDVFALEVVLVVACLVPFFEGGGADVAAPPVDTAGLDELHPILFSLS